MAYRIIDANEALIPGIERLERLCFSVPWTAEQIHSQLPDGEHLMLAALNDSGEVLGYIGAMRAADEGYISNVAVAPEARRQGIGDALIDRLVRKSAERQLAFLTLEVRESNAPARALYRKHGFSDAGVRKNYYEKPRENAILMTLFLK